MTLIKFRFASIRIDSQGSGTLMASNLPRDGDDIEMIFVGGLNKREVRRMLLVGTPWFLTILVAAQGLKPVWYLLFGFVAFLPYSYFYVLAYKGTEARLGHRPGWPFYVWAVVAQLLAIGILWAATAF